MNFYNRELELKQLSVLEEQSQSCSRLTVLTGRRRVGKTRLALKFVEDKRFLYLFVSKKAENLLCADYLREIQRVFPDRSIVGEFHRFRDIFQLLLEIATEKHFTLIIDEFQEFLSINASVYSEIQNLWNRYKEQSALNLICIGSVYSLMNRLFQDGKEPLFGRADRMIRVPPFSIATLETILADHNVLSADSLFNYYLFTGGLPKYVDWLVNNEVWDYEGIVNLMMEANSPFLEEGKFVLIEEFGKGCGNYFSILEMIARGKTSRAEMESITEGSLGGFLDRLENEYSIIAKQKPITAKPNSRLQHYFIRDHFLNFWFRFIYRQRTAIEMGNFSYLKEIIHRDYSSYAGFILERFFRQRFAESGFYNQVGQYWESRHQNEIDLVAVNDLEKILLIAEVKMNKTKINLKVLKEKSEKLIAHYPKYKPTWQALSLEDILN